MTLRLVCDTNVLVSALIAAGPPSRIIEEAIRGRIALVLPEPVLIELERVLMAKLGFKPERWREVEAFLIELASERIAVPEGGMDEVTQDPADDLILACAVAADVDAVISGDRRHLLSLGEHKGIRIISPQAFLAEMLRP